MSLAKSLLREVLAAAAQHQAHRVSGITVRIGGLCQLEPDLLRAAVAACAVRTMAEGAILSIEPVAPVARCRKCGQSYSPAPLSYLCPRCGRTDAELLAGEELLLSALELEVEQQEVPA